MAITFKVLGHAKGDNALWVRVDEGDSVSHYLFDCGANTVGALSMSQTLDIRHVFFSHFHMDHICGFDEYFRRVYAREEDNVLWGPPGSAEILHHRLRGYSWNLVSDCPARWSLREVQPVRAADSPHALCVLSRDYAAADGFQRCDLAPAQFSDAGVLLDAPGHTIESIALKHHGISLAYLIREKPRKNIDMTALSAHGLRPGPWLQALKDDSQNGDVAVGGTSYSLERLRELAVRESPGQSVAYVTDFLLDAETHERLVAWLSGCDVLVCEGQYLHQDLELAHRNHHATATLVGRLARDAGVGELVLFHLSERYTREEWLALRDECRAQFARAKFPADWVAEIEG
ncbi:MAG: hypothetical protein KDB14_07335 [Planctomycetales bacterium]|nr:hypothetical protein [Planctomycetales bacterium]